MHWGELNYPSEPEAQKRLRPNADREETDCILSIVPKEERKFRCGKKAHDDTEVDRLSAALKAPEDVLYKSISMPALVGPDAQFIAKIWRERVAAKNSTDFENEEKFAIGAKNGAESRNFAKGTPIIRIRQPTIDDLKRKWNQ